MRDRERPGPSENQANFSQERIKVLNKVIDVRIWWSVDDTNNYIFDKDQQISMNNDSVEGDDILRKVKSGRGLNSKSLLT